MANVRKYTEQIASAKKGKDVRAAHIPVGTTGRMRRLFLQSMRCLMRIIHTIRQRRTSRRHKSQSMQT